MSYGGYGPPQAQNYGPPQSQGYGPPQQYGPPHQGPAQGQGYPPQNPNHGLPPDWIAEWVSPFPTNESPQISSYHLEEADIRICRMPLTTVGFT